MISRKNAVWGNVIVSDIRNGADRKYMPFCCLSPHGASGLKSYDQVLDGRIVSHPVRGVWIEITAPLARTNALSVSPITGRVD